MSPPRKYTDPLQGVLCETSSAMSALNMEPAPITPPRGLYLSETDYWAEHAMEHLAAVSELCGRAINEKERMELALGELRFKVKTLETRLARHEGVPPDGYSVVADVEVPVAKEVETKVDVSLATKIRKPR